MQLRFEVEQGGGDDRHHYGWRAIAEPDHRAIAEAKQDGDHRGGARVALIGVAVIGGDHHGADQQEADGDDPGRSGAFGDQRADRAEYGNQPEGTQAGARSRVALAFEADQQADAEAGEQCRQIVEAGVVEQVRVHGGQSAGAFEGVGRRRPAPIMRSSALHFRRSG